MTTTANPILKKLAEQKAKVLAKVAEINALCEQKYALFNSDGSYPCENLDPICEMITKVNRAEGVLKRLVKKAIELYYLLSGIKYDTKWMDSEYEYVGEYLRSYNRTFGVSLTIK